MKSIFTLAAFSIIMATGAPATVAHAGAEKRCLACHTFGESNKMGPGLKGVFGRQAGTQPGFAYGDSLKNGGWVWDEEKLRKWIYDSPEAIRELSGDANATTKMPKYRIKGKKADEIIEFLKGLQ